MAEEKKNSTLAQEKAELDKKVADNKNARDEENLSKDELDAVAGGAPRSDCRPRASYNS